MAARKQNTSSKTKSKKTSGKSSGRKGTSQAYTYHPKKKSKASLIVLIIVLVLLVLLGICVYPVVNRYLAERENTSEEETTTTSSYNYSNPDYDADKIGDGIVYGNFRLNFMELGAYNAGDSIYIKAGDTDILIDAGSTKASATTIEKYVDQYCTDGKLEYVITTHSHNDHIAGMVGSTGSKLKNHAGESVTNTGILYYYDVGTIIDFALTDSTSVIYNDYEEAVSYAVSKGAVHYTAAECFENKNCAKDTYSICENGQFKILYNYYYFNSAKNTEGEENNYSVCTLFTYGQSNFMLTGDLEAEGEEKLAAYYDKSTEAKTLPHCELFKAGHHGSKTSSNDCLLKLITPEICCVCCCAGGSEYTNNSLNTFPTQDFIDRIAKYTDRVYVTSVVDEAKTRETGDFVFGSMNGNIVVSSNGYNIGIKGSSNNTKLRETTWFNETVYVVYDGKNPLICSGAKKKDFYTSSSSGAVAMTRRTWPKDGVTTDYNEKTSEDTSEASETPVSESTSEAYSENSEQATTESSSVIENSEVLTENNVSEETSEVNYTEKEITIALNSTNNGIASAYSSEETTWESNGITFGYVNCKQSSGYVMMGSKDQKLTASFYNVSALEGTIKKITVTYGTSCSASAETRVQFSSSPITSASESGMTHIGGGTYEAECSVDDALYFALSSTSTSYNAQIKSVSVILCVPAE